MKPQQPKVPGKLTMPSRRLIDKVNPAPYVPACQTDLRRTFAEARLRLGVKRG